jgi:hypothetical protein
MQNALPLSVAFRVRVRFGGEVGVAPWQAAAAGGPLEGAALPDDPLPPGPDGCCPQAVVRADTPMTAAAARDQTLRMRTSQSRAMSTGQVRFAHEA